MTLLSESQLRQVKAAAALLPTFQRDEFLRSISNRLADLDRIDDADVAAAVDFVLNTRGVAIGGRAKLRR
jgi:hypothetical protein